MVYLTYRRYELNYIKALEDVNDILDEKTVIFQRTQPKSPVMDSERVDGGKREDKAQQYVIQMEQKHIEERLEEAKSILSERKELLKEKEQELRSSNDIEDVIFCYKNFENMKNGEIARKIVYSESHVYRILKNMRENLKMIENERK